MIKPSYSTTAMAHPPIIGQGLYTVWPPPTWLPACSAASLKPWIIRVVATSCYCEFISVDTPRIMRVSWMRVMPMAQRSDRVLQRAMRPNMQGDSTRGQKKSRVETRVWGPTLMVETSGVSMPTGLGSFCRQDKSLFCGTLHPHPFILVKFVSTKSALRPQATGSNRLTFPGFPSPAADPTEAFTNSSSLFRSDQRERIIIIKYIFQVRSQINLHRLYQRPVFIQKMILIPQLIVKDNNPHTMMISRMIMRGITTIAKPTIMNPRLSVPLVRYRFTSTSDPTQIALLQQVEAKVYQVLKSAAKCNHAKLNKSATFEQLGFDSLDSVQLVVAMEQYFGFDIPNEEAQKIGTVEAAVNTFYRHLNAKMANKIVEGDQNNKEIK